MSLAASLPQDSPEVTLPTFAQVGRCSIGIRLADPNTPVVLESLQTILDITNYFSNECIRKAHRTAGWTLPTQHSHLNVSLRIVADRQDPEYLRLWLLGRHYQNYRSADGQRRYANYMNAAEDYRTYVGAGPFS